MVELGQGLDYSIFKIDSVKLRLAVSQNLGEGVIKRLTQTLQELNRLAITRALVRQNNQTQTLIWERIPASKGGYLFLVGLQDTSVLSQNAQRVVHELEVGQDVGLTAE